MCLGIGVLMIFLSQSIILSQSQGILSSTSLDSCNFASLQCSYRTGCGTALKSYLIECDPLIQNRTQDCTEGCKNTLIGLTSTPEGQRLMTCDCEDDRCRRAKVHLETCRREVLYATRNDTVVSCSEARWICMSDAECGKALEYYHHLCRAMFKGRRCTERCKNSVSILSRQGQAAKLSQCECRANETIDEFQCSVVQENMSRLCFDRKEVEREELGNGEGKSGTVTNVVVEGGGDVLDNKVSSLDDRAKMDRACALPTARLAFEILFICKFIQTWFYQNAI
ncbi:hypothetical protein TCAL_05161 [Tigriopus californicus]|uniref:GDNF/GAS1 domain-containing protein n=1 Tax=Tigriopus californicus TaxID=6832 RepID=A0A553NQQ8_TIGCA|nr:growth arrest-specific protein 1-like [Tigriopus californicus]TRY67767.1 hypothetical protein TCAL_05161 [Tigriopus californicus]|eukprot:TCALIF_05161-PA protein Name:"Similar to Gas1 Growth arrest-specific protein 1 (Mus musculus)" AED:0.00 eAED:0.00 QI:366/1/1/1/1/1/3/16/281